MPVAGFRAERPSELANHIEPASPPAWAVGRADLERATGGVPVAPYVTHFVRHT